MTKAVKLPVTVSGVGLLCSAGIGLSGLNTAPPGPVPGFRARDYVSDRKRLKLMTRGVQLGVAGVNLALAACEGWQHHPPDRRGIYVGASPQLADSHELAPALNSAMTQDGFDLQKFATQGYPLIHPLWLLRGLSNNILGMTSATHNLQGVNANYCDGSEGGWTAILEGAHAVADGRADLAIAGGADALVGADTLVGQPCGEGAAFMVFTRSTTQTLTLDRSVLSSQSQELGYLGAAQWPVAFARFFLKQSGCS